MQAEPHLASMVIPPLVLASLVGYHCNLFTLFGMYCQVLTTSHYRIKPPLALDISYRYT